MQRRVPRTLLRLLHRARDWPIRLWHRARNRLLWLLRVRERRRLRDRARDRLLRLLDLHWVARAISVTWLDRGGGGPCPLRAVVAVGDVVALLR